MTASFALIALSLMAVAAVVQAVFLLMKGGKRYGFEFKLTSSPRISPSMRIALRDLELERLWVVHPGEGIWPLDERIEAISSRELLSWTIIPGTEP